jgi:hypothetical protein
VLFRKSLVSEGRKFLIELFWAAVVLSSCLGALLWVLAVAVVMIGACNQLESHSSAEQPLLDGIAAGLILFGVGCTGFLLSGILAGAAFLVHESKCQRRLHAARSLASQVKELEDVGYGDIR